VGVLGAQAFPTFIEYQAALKAIDKAKAGSNPVADVRRSIFDKAAQIDDIKSISRARTSKSHRTMARQGSCVCLYQREIHMAGPAYLTIKYDGRSK
jgi:hypothetical protein